METQNITTTEDFTNAIRAVLIEIDIDRLPLPINISAIDHRPERGVSVLVRDEDFTTYRQVLANPVEFTVGDLQEGSDGRMIQFLTATGVISGHRVQVTSVHTVAQAVAS